MESRREEVIKVEQKRLRLGVQGLFNLRFS